MRLAPPAAGCGVHDDPRNAPLLRALRHRAVRLDGARVLDVGAGNGVFGLAAGVLGAKEVVLTDSHPDAAALALRNAQLNSLGPPRVRAYTGDFLEPVTSASLPPFDVVLMTPPQMGGPQPQLAASRPDKSAGRDGALFHVRLAQEVGAVLKPGGRVLYCATGLTNRRRAAEAFAAAGFSAPPLVVAQQQRRFTAAGLDALCDGLMAHQLKQRQRGEAEFEEEEALGDGGTSYRMVQEVLLVQRGA